MVSSTSGDNTITIIMVVVGLVIAIIVLWLILGGKKKKVEYAEVIEVSPLEEDMEWD